MSQFVVSSPGKIILHGEHAVVYGKKAVACSLNVRTFCRIKSTDSGSVEVDLPNIDMNRKWLIKDLKLLLPVPLGDGSAPCPVQEELLNKLKVFVGVSENTCDTKLLALVAFLYLYSCILYVNGNLTSAQLTISSKLPTGAGLGSSAAYSTSLAACLLLHRKLIQEPVPDNSNHSSGSWTKDDLHLINSWAFQAEKIIHGNPSGIDNSVSTFGGALQFQKGIITPIQSVPPLRVLLVNTKIPRSTKALVSGVKEKYEKYPEIISPVLDSIESICQKCVDTFEAMTKASENQENYYSTLQDLIVMNQKLLELLGVSHKALQDICDTASNCGLAAKLTGAGGGGCAFILIPPGTSQDVVHQVGEEIKVYGYDVWETSVCGKGVLLHFDLNHEEFDIPDILK